MLGPGDSPKGSLQVCDDRSAWLQRRRRPSREVGLLDRGGGEADREDGGESGEWAAHHTGRPRLRLHVLVQVRGKAAGSGEHRVTHVGCFENVRFVEWFTSGSAFVRGVRFVQRSRFEGSLCCYLVAYKQVGALTLEGRVKTRGDTLPFRFAKIANKHPPLSVIVTVLIPSHRYVLSSHRSADSRWCRTTSRWVLHCCC